LIRITIATQRVAVFAHIRCEIISVSIASATHGNIPLRICCRMKKRYFRFDWRNDNILNRRNCSSVRLLKEFIGNNKLKRNEKHHMIRGSNIKYFLGKRLKDRPNSIVRSHSISQL